MPDIPCKNAPPAGTLGAQRLCLDQLRAWQQLAYGMFIHFGMSTYDGNEHSKGDQPSSVYAPNQLDVDQWIQVARDAGMRYAVLTTKHVAGHCLWPTKHTDYNVSTSGNKTDVVEAFVKACEKHGIKPGFYYCSWDNHNTFSSITPTMTGDFTISFTTAAYREFQLAQIEELLTQYGPVAEMWIDIPNLLGPDGRRQQYDQIARLAPETVIMMNSGVSDGSQFKYDNVWPTDLIAIERFLPNSNRGYKPWFEISHTVADKADYYIPGEVCDPIGYDWFCTNGDRPRTDTELLGMRLICQARGVNLLLNVPPNRHGVIPDYNIQALDRLRKNLEQLDLS